MKLIPATVDDLTASYFTECLRSSGVLTEGAVSDAQVSLNGAGRGVAADIARAELRYSADAPPGAPSTLIVKFPSSDPARRRGFSRNGAYRNEANFYLHIAAQVSLATPTCYFAHVDEATGESVIFLEDMSYARTWAEDGGLTPGLAAKAVELLGRFHGNWLNDDAVARLPPVWDLRDRLIPVSRGFPSLWREIKETNGSGLAADIRQYGDRLTDILESDPESLLPHDFSLRHGDAHPDNFFFRGEEDHAEIVFIDWQMVSIGDPALDFVVLITRGLPPERIAAEYEDLRNRYYAAVVSAAKSEFSEQQLSVSIKNSLPVQFMRACAIRYRQAPNMPVSREIWDRACAGVRRVW